MTVFADSFETAKHFAKTGHGRYVHRLHDTGKYFVSDDKDYLNADMIYEAGKAQKQVTVCVGYPEDESPYKTNSKTFKFILAKCVSVVNGGCFISDGLGYWTEDGANHCDEFTGRLQSEESFELTTTCEEHKFDRLMEQIKHGAKRAKLKSGLDVEWVHVKVVDIAGHHFKI